MSRESNDGRVCPACDTVIYREECACEELGVAGNQNVPPGASWLAARQVTPTFPSPLLAKHKLDVSWEDLT